MEYIFHGLILLACFYRPVRHSFDFCFRNKGFNYRLYEGAVSAIDQGQREGFRWQVLVQEAVKNKSDYQ
jgi:hypothetical protein